jgi:hypothetical protein
VAAASRRATRPATNLDCRRQDGRVVVRIEIIGLNIVVRIERHLDLIIAGEVGGIPGPFIDAFGLASPVAPVERPASDFLAVDGNDGHHVAHVERRRHIGQQLEGYLVTGINIGHRVQDDVCG